MRTIAACVAAVGLMASATAPAVSGEDPLLSVRAAALAGEPRALVELALKYENAEGVPRDQQAANRLFCGAARQGDAEALYRLGWAYANGRGGMRDDDMAAALLALAAEQGHDYAARLLGHLPRQAVARLPSCMRDERLTVSLDDSARAPGDGAAFRADGASRVLIEARVPRGVRQIVEQVASRYVVDADLVLAVIAVESDFDAAAVSPRNAQGLMQLMPETAARFGVRWPFDPVENVKGGVAYLRWLLAFFEGDVRLVLAAYNAGERAVERYGGIPPYAETREYVRRTTAIYAKRTHFYDPGVVSPSALVRRRPRAVQPAY